jgi:hypothetical protein
VKSEALCLALLLCCDEKPSSTTDAAAEAATPAVTASTPPAPPKPPVVTLDDGAFVVGGDKVDLVVPDAKARIVAMLANKPLVSGQTLEVDALRDTTMPHFSIAMDALRDAKVKSATVKTATRDRTMGTLEVSIDHGATAPCSAVGMVGKDNAINIWPYSGATAQRFSHGFAGPDMTLGSAALKTLASSCDSTFYFVAGDDAIKWGVVFDLATASAAQPGFKPTNVIVLAKPPVPGHKITE